MTLNTYIAGEPSAGHELAGFLNRRADSVHDKATSWHDARKSAEADWEGPASEAFINNRATPNARDADALSDINRELARPFTAWADGITAAKDWMQRAQGVARDAELVVLDHAIHPPKTPEQLASVSPGGQINAADREAQATKQAAFAEAQALVRHARELERQAHDELRAALTRETEALKSLGQFDEWSHAARSASTPAATDMMNLVTDLENKSVHATQGAFERAAAQGPYATHSMWSALTNEQRADLIARHPKLIGDTNGIPAVDRDIANRRILEAQRQELISRIERERENTLRSGSLTGGADHSRKLAELEQALEGLNKLDQKLGNSAEESSYYLLGIDSTDADRGKAIIASGNPDTAQHVTTMVPGTFSDLGDTINYVNQGDQLSRQAQAVDSNKDTFAHITYTDYTSPPELPTAADKSYANEGKADLAEFQEGLTATRSPEAPPCHRVVMGHSYGTTLIGYTARDHGLSADDMVLLGSPGTGVDHASELLPNGRVWAAAAPLDPVPAAPDVWYGPSPADPDFGAHQVLTDSWGGHNSYFTQSESGDAMARIVAGKAQG